MQIPPVSGQSQTHALGKRCETGLREEPDVLPAFRRVVPPAIDAPRSGWHQLRRDQDDRSQRPQPFDSRDRLRKMLDQLECGDHIELTFQIGLESACKEIRAVLVVPTEIVSTVAHEPDQETGSRTEIKGAVDIPK